MNARKTTALLFGILIATIAASPSAASAQVASDPDPLGRGRNEWDLRIERSATIFRAPGLWLGDRASQGRFAASLQRSFERFLADPKSALRDERRTRRKANSALRAAFESMAFGALGDSSPGTTGYLGGASPLRPAIDWREFVSNGFEDLSVRSTLFEGRALGDGWNGGGELILGLDPASSGALESIRLRFSAKSDSANLKASIGWRKGLSFGVSFTSRF